jgi:hypothetical protein
MKDACYKKVKASYDVFPSARASQAIAKCRKGSGAVNKSEKAQSEALAGGEVGGHEEWQGVWCGWQERVLPSDQESICTDSEDQVRD